MRIAHPQTAFSLLELLVSLTIVGVVTAAGLPPLQRWTATRALDSAVFDLQRDLHHARLTAARTGHSIALCPSLSARRCDAGATFDDGWISFINHDGDSPVQRDVDEPVLRTHAGSTNIRLLSNRRAFRQSPPGRRSINGTIIACHRDAGVAPRSLVVSYTGRARTSQSNGTGGCP
ncbi:MAG: GspH/FimT family pseudopilin [Pseudomonadota bacterium]